MREPIPEPLLSERLLLGPGPSNVAPEVRAALARPTIGHLDPDFLELLDQVQAMIAEVFGTNDSLTLPISATGSAGMEACLINLIEPGDRVLVGINGVFGTRMATIVERCGGEVIRCEAPMGEPLDTDRFIGLLERERPQVAAVVHAETSTGVAQPVAALGHAARRANALLVLDCVTSLSGMPVALDEWQVDAAYSGTQKCLGCPPGLSPIAFGPRAIERLQRRKVPVQSWYLDLSLILGYFGEARVYHHTAPINMIYALHEALRRALNEGLEARFARHHLAHEHLVKRLEALGFEFWVAPEFRLPMLNTVVPPVSDEAKLRRRLLIEHGIEIGAGLGELAGRVWRIGLMGENARIEVVDRFVDTLEPLLKA